MLNRLRHLRADYPRQFWLLFAGLLISTTGASMIWPFLMIYVSERLDLPMTAVASLLTLNAATGLLFSFIAGSVIDRFGRKWVMALSLAVNGIGFMLMSQATTLPAFALLMALSGAFNPLYRVGADAMMADLIAPEKRVDAYSLLRMSNNVGVALGPAIGGVLATISYSRAFLFAAAGMIAYSLLVTIFATETMPVLSPADRPEKERLGGYDRIFRDKPFITFIASFTLTQVCAVLMWVLMALYAKQNYNVPESQYGFIPTTNALMVVFLQYSVTQVTKRYAALMALGVGSLFYAVGVGSVAFSQGFGGFWLSMVVLTIGELILNPTATTYTANLAPAEMRGRYMSLYGLTWGVAAGIGPLLGGLLSDSIGPKSIWYGGLVIGLLSAGFFFLLARRYPQPVPPAGKRVHIS